MASFSNELKDNRAFSSDPKLNLIPRASSRTVALLVEGKENTRAGLDLCEPKLYEGTAGPSFGCCTPLPENDGTMVGVGGSTPEEETGNVNPELVLEVNGHLDSCLLIDIEGKTGLVVEDVELPLFMASVAAKVLP